MVWKPSWRQRIALKWHIAGPGFWRYWRRGSVFGPGLLGWDAVYHRNQPPNVYEIGTIHSVRCHRFWLWPICITYTPKPFYYPGWDARRKKRHATRTQTHS